MNYERFFQLIDRAYVLAWCVAGAFTGVVTSTLLLLVLAGDAFIRMLYTLAVFAVLYLAAVTAYWFTRRAIAQMEYRRCEPRTSTAMTRRRVEFKSPVRILPPEKDPR